MDSILSQIRNIDRVLIIDDGSSDLTPEICDAYLINQPQVDVIHKENGGVSSVRNLGIKLTRTDWLFFVDGDDQLSPYALENMQQYLDDTSSEVLLFLFESIDETGKLVSETTKTSGEEDFICGDELTLWKQTVLYTNQVEKAKYASFSRGASWGKLFRTKFLQNNNILFDERLPVSEDLVFAFKYLHFAKQLRLIYKTVYQYRQSIVGISRNFSAHVLSKIRYVGDSYKEVLVFFDEYEIKDYHEGYIDRCMRQAVWALKSGPYHSGCHWKRNQRIAWIRKLVSIPWVEEAVTEYPHIERTDNLCLLISILLKLRLLNIMDILFHSYIAIRKRK